PPCCSALISTTAAMPLRPSTMKPTMIGVTCRTRIVTKIEPIQLFLPCGRLHQTFLFRPRGTFYLPRLVAHKPLCWTALPHRLDCAGCPPTERPIAAPGLVMRQPRDPVAAHTLTDEQH